MVADRGRVRLRPRRSPQFTEIRLLDPRTGEDRRLVSAEGYPYIIGLVWSPRGRWGGDFKQRIDVIDVTDRRRPERRLDPKTAHESG